MDSTDRLSRKGRAGVGQLLEIRVTASHRQSGLEPSELRTCRGLIEWRFILATLPVAAMESLSHAHFRNVIHHCGEPLMHLDTTVISDGSIRANNIERLC